LTSYLEEKAASVKLAENTAVGIHRADHVAPSIRKSLAVTSPRSGRRLVGIVRSRTEATEVVKSVTVKSTVFWVVTLCSCRETYR
jgi:hypothetical protein